MPRDGAGNVTLPISNPVTSGTLVTDEWANDTMSDIRTMLEDSVSRSGLGGPTQPLQLPDGAEGPIDHFLPTIRILAYTFAGPGEVVLVVDGEPTMRWTPDGTDVWDPDTEAWTPVTATDVFQGNIETKVVSTPGELVYVFTNDINAAGIFINGPDVDNGALLLGTDYDYDTGTKTVTLTQSYPVGTNITARRILNFNPDDVVVFPVYNTVAAAKAADLAVNTLTRTKGKVTVGDTLGATYLVRPAQVVDEDDDHTMANGNVLLLQRFAADMVGYVPVGGGSSDVQTVLAEVEGDIDTLQTQATDGDAAITALQANDATQDGRLDALEASPGDTFSVYESAEIAITSTGQKSSVAHGIGAIPRMFWAYLRCKITEHGYGVGDELLMSPGVRNDGEEDGIQVYANSTNIGFITGNRYALTVYDSVGNQQTITNNNWRVVLRAIE